MKLAWLTDIHLNFLGDLGVNLFCAELARTEAEAFLISGDIGESPSLLHYLNQLDDALARPIYFVLGNHDFYRGSIAEVRKQVDALCIAYRTLHWLPTSGVVPLTEETCLVGHDGWGDGRYGDYAGSRVALNDWKVIKELTELDPEERLTKLHALGDEAAAHFRSVLPDALARFRHVIALIHVPPFREACWHKKQISAEDWLPHFTCQAAGDSLREAMEAHRGSANDGPVRPHARRGNRPDSPEPEGADGRGGVREAEGGGGAGGRVMTA